MRPLCAFKPLLAATLSLFPLTLFGQQAIVHMPSADITPKGQGFVMHETQWRPWGDGSPGVINQNVGLGFKSAVPLGGGAAEKKLTVGSMALVNYKGMGVGNFTYSHYSFRLP